MTDIAAAPVLKRLLKENVLTEFVTPSSGKVDSSVLSFSHHLIHDYAVARLLLRGTPLDLCRELERDPEMVLPAWVSLEMHFRYMWWYDRPNFWATLFTLEDASQAPALGKIIGPAVAADLIESPADYEPLLQKMDSNDTNGRRCAEGVFSHIVGRLSVLSPDSRRPLVGKNAPPWAGLLAEVSKR